MFFKSSKKKLQKKLDELCTQADIFIQVHYVRESNTAHDKFHSLISKDDPNRRNLLEFLAENGNPEEFAPLCLLFLKRTEKDENQISDLAHLEKGYFTRLRTADSFFPSRGEVLLVCFAMKLNAEESRVLLKSAGYVLSNSNKADLIIRYFIESGNYSLSDLDYVLKQLCDITLEQAVS